MTMLKLLFKGRFSGNPQAHSRCKESVQSDGAIALSISGVDPVASSMTVISFLTVVTSVYDWQNSKVRFSYGLIH